MTQNNLAYLRDRLQELKDKEGLRPLANRVGIPVGQIRSLLSGRSSLSTTVESICAALGMEFYVGPPRKPVAAAPGAAGDETERLLEGLMAAVERLGGDRDQVEVPVYGAEVVEGLRHLDRTAECTFPYRTTWLIRYGVDPNRCFMVRLRGEAMEPTLPDGCYVLVNESAMELQNGRVFLVRQETIQVRRAERRAGAWWLKSDSRPDSPRLWKRSGEVLGEIVWMARHVRLRHLEASDETSSAMTRAATTHTGHPPLYIHRDPATGKPRPVPPPADGNNF